MKFWWWEPSVAQEARPWYLGRNIDVLTIFFARPWILLNLLHNLHWSWAWSSGLSPTLGGRFLPSIWPSANSLPACPSPGASNFFSLPHLSTPWRGWESPPAHWPGSWVRWQGCRFKTFFAFNICAACRNPTGLGYGGTGIRGQGHHSCCTAAKRWQYSTRRNGVNVRRLFGHLFLTNFKKRKREGSILAKRRNPKLGEILGSFMYRYIK